MDHGILNTSLKSRGNIDAQIDSYKAGLASDAKAKRRVAETARKAAKIEASELFEAVTDDRLAELAIRCKSSVSDLRKHLKSQCHWDPTFVIRLLSA